MTLAEIKTLLTGVDPKMRHYFSMSGDDAYSFWEETRRLPLISDDLHTEGWRFYVHRFTKTENDETAAALFAALDADPRTTVIWVTDYEPETGYIHHIFECEG